MPEDQVAAGAGAAELDVPRDIAANPDNGHIYISELLNSRISEYTAWGLFVRAWGWGVVDGASELQTCGPAEPEANPPAGLCQQGSSGGGEGQLNGPFGLTLDAAGDVYVFELANRRIQKFSPTGGFLVMFGGEVNKTKVEGGAPAPQQNVCPVDPGDVCQAGSSGTGPSHFDGGVGNYIAYDPNADTIVVGDADRIQVFEPDGDFKEEIPFEGELEAFAGKSVTALDVDAAGSIYLTVSGLEDVYKLSPAGEPLAPGKPGESQFEVATPAAVAVDVEGNVYAIDKGTGTGTDRVVEYDAAANRLLPTLEEEEEGTKKEEAGDSTAGVFFPYLPFFGPSLSGLGTNICADGTSPDSEAPGNLYVAFFTGSAPRISHVNAYGTAPIGCEPPPPEPPEVREQFATAVGRAEATLKARINPRFWPDTTYYVEYGTGECSAEGCGGKAPLDPALLTSKSTSKALTTAGVVLGGLQPATTYHYRFVAESSGGGPVYGIDPDGREGPGEASFEEGLDATFRTFAAAQAQSCPNESFRTGVGASLPDCRAYELVSPLEKGNADVAPWVGRNAIFPIFFELHQSAPSGERLTYTSWTSFGGQAGAGFVSQYLAERGAGGWGSKGLSPPRTTSSVTDNLPLLSADFHGFSEDLCMAWFRIYSSAPLADGAIPKYPNFYRRENCGSSPNYLALSPVKPEDKTANEYYELRIQGFSDDGSHAIFTANGKLDADAPTMPPLKEKIDLLLYEHTPQGLRFVCYLPNGTPVTQPCGAGTAAGAGGGSVSSAHNAISADGERIFWTVYNGTPGFAFDPGAPGRVFVRIDGSETRRVSGTVAQDPAWFWTAADDGSKAVVVFDDAGSLPHASELYEVDVETETPTLIAEGVEGPMGASEDASRIYFASTEDLDGAGEGTKGAHNLYFYEAGVGGGEPTYAFVMALAARDIRGFYDQPAPIDEIPAQRWARVSADGLHATFVSVASPTPSGYDNRDATSGEAAREVYHYDAALDKLVCVSCNPTGARPSAEDLGGPSNPVFVAAKIQGWEALGHAPRVLSEDGSRVFFESIEALAPQDTNGVWDVYQWEEVGKESCTTSRASFSEEAQGCIDLISSGESARDATFLDADPSGDNVFIGTLDSLVPQDYGLNDVYDARVGGGFPPPAKKNDCEGEACQSPPAPPQAVTPASEAFEGPESPNSKPRRRRCRAGTHRVRRNGKTRCVRKKARRHAKRRAVR